MTFLSNSLQANEKTNSGERAWPVWEAAKSSSDEKSKWLGLWVFFLSALGPDNRGPVLSPVH